MPLDLGVRILGPNLVRGGSHVRTGAGFISSGDDSLTIDDHVRLAAGAKISASSGLVTLGNLAILWADVKVYTHSDDYTGCSLTKPTVRLRSMDLTVGPVVRKEHAVGACNALLSGTILRYGAAAGALSLVRGEDL